MRHFYSAALYLMQPFLLLRLLWRSRRVPAYRQRIAERYGFVDAAASNKQVIWVHAVSLGETQAAAPLVDALLEGYPDYQLVVTTTTPTGSERVVSLFGEKVFHCYAPWDLPGAVRRFLDRSQPSLLVLMETELWPNILNHCHRRGCRVVLANARLSRRSAAGYGRFPGITRIMLGQLDVVACQSREDGQRFVELGLPPDRLKVTGSLKYELHVDERMRARSLELRAACGSDSRSILLAASTHPGEEELVLDAFAVLRERDSNCLLILAPRHPERTVEVEALCRSSGRTVLRWSGMDVSGVAADIVLVDTVGDLPVLQSVADVVLVGGSLVNHGGHNPLEAAAWGVALVCGPSMENFSAISDELLEGGAMIRAAPEDLADTLSTVFAERERREAMGAKGLRVVESNRGALDQVLQILEAELAA